MDKNDRSVDVCAHVLPWLVLFGKCFDEGCKKLMCRMAIESAFLTLFLFYVSVLAIFGEVRSGYIWY